MNNQSIKFPMFSNKKFSFLRPFLELYLKYLEEFHSEDVRTSQKLAKITVNIIFINILYYI